MKLSKVFKSLLFSSVALIANAQATVPSSFSNFALPTSSWPTGFTGSLGTSGNFSYAGGSDADAACRLDLQGEYVMLNIASTEVPGAISYYLKGATSNSAPFSGTFTLQESANGSTWTDLHVFTNTQVSVSAFAQITDNPNPASRFFRWYFTTKVSGSNIALDQISVALPTPTAQQEIFIKNGTTPYPLNSTYVANSAVGTPLQIDFSIQNLGITNTLNIASATFSGSSAAEYSVTIPASVGPNSTTTFSVFFTPTANGTRPAILSIVNDDADENPYLINFNCIGGTAASEPTANPTNLTFNNVKSYTLNGSFTAVPSVDGYLVLKSASAITGTPTDGVVYKVGDMVGNAKVTYVGAATTFTPKEIIANTTFNFAVYAYNGAGTLVNYKETAPLTGSTTTPNGNIGSYYSSITAGNASFINDVHTKISTGTNIIFYSNYKTTILRDFEERDTTNGQKAVECVYSGYYTIYTPPFDFLASDFSREHTYPQSWMATVNDPNFQNLPEYADLHNLFPAKQNNVNQVRSNYPLGEVVTPLNPYLNGKLGLDANGFTVYEPQDKHKGDAARAMAYHSMRYTTIGGNWYIPANQNQNVLKDWNTQDPPSNYEIARNDYIQSIQGNRNPFIDNPNWMCLIDFHTLTTVSGSPCFVGIDEKNSNKVSVYPNPSNTKIITIEVPNVSNEKATISITDATGRNCFNTTLSNNNTLINETLNLNMLSSGVYTITVNLGNEKLTKKLILN